MRNRRRGVANPGRMSPSASLRTGLRGLEPEFSRNLTAVTRPCRTGSRINFVRAVFIASRSRATTRCLKTHRPSRPAARPPSRDHQQGSAAMTRSFQAVLLTAVGLGALSASGGTADAQFKQTNLVRDPWPGYPNRLEPHQHLGRFRYSGSNSVLDLKPRDRDVQLVLGGGQRRRRAGRFLSEPAWPQYQLRRRPARTWTGRWTHRPSRKSGWNFLRHRWRAGGVHFRQSGRLNFCLEYVEHKQRRAKRRDCRSVDPGRRLHRIGHQQRGQLALRRQWSGKRLHRRLQRLIRSDRRPRRICRSDPALRICSLQCRGHRRQGLRDLCASGARGPDKRDRGHGLGGRFR